MAPFNYATHTLQNTSNNSICVSVELVTLGSSAQVVAYLGSFDPTNILLNYLADARGSADSANGILFSFVFPAHSQVTFVVYSPLNNPNTGDYTLTIYGISASVPCLHPETLVEIFANGRNQTLMIQDIKASDRIVDFKGKAVPVMYNIKLESAVTKFVRIQKDSLGVSLPRADILIREGHPIMYNGREENPLKLARKLMKQKVIKLVEINNSVKTYSLCTKKRTFMMVEGLPIATWSNKDWLSHTAKNPNVAWSKK